MALVILVAIPLFTPASSILLLRQEGSSLLDRMVARGPDYLHAAAAYEPEVIAYNSRFPNLTQPLEFIFPADVTFWMNNPLCVLVSEMEFGILSNPRDRNPPCDNCRTTCLGRHR